MKANYVVSQILAKKMKPLTNGEHVKECMVAVSKLMFPEKIRETEDSSLSSFISCCRIDYIAGSTEKSLINTIHILQAYALALDKSVDSSDTTQFAIFIQGVNGDFNVTGEMAALQSMKGTITGADMMEILEKVMVKLLDIQQILSVL